MDDALILLTQANHLGIFGPLAKPHVTSLMTSLCPCLLNPRLPRLFHFFISFLNFYAYSIIQSCLDYERPEGSVLNNCHNSKNVGKCHHISS